MDLYPSSICVVEEFSPTGITILVDSGFKHKKNNLGSGVG